MSAYANAKALGRDAVLEKIAALDLYETGVYREKMTDHIRKAQDAAAEEGVQLHAVAALNNADTDMVFLELVKQAPEKVVEGCAIAAIAAGADQAVLMLPEKEEELAQSLKEKAAACGVAVVNEFLNIRQNQTNLLVHIASCVDLADAFSDSYEPGIYVSVNGEALKKVPADEKVSELVDVSAAKAVQVGYAYYTPEECGVPVGELNPANGVIRVLTEKNCIVDDAAKKTLACKAQSCGKCVFCREGLIQLEFMQSETTLGRGKMEFLDLTKEIGEAMCFSTPCSMGQQSARISLSAMGKFASEYEAHIKKKNCPAGVCQ
ncbi:MAG TPA: iron reductase subunit beta, partial [Lachnospiraceae bacterium]|nr:iron reductase subunit beta [Lachnospiraceae bacterium]